MSNLSLAYDLATELARFMFPETSDNRARFATRAEGGDITEEEQRATIMRRLQGDKLRRLRATSEGVKAERERTRQSVLAYGKLVYDNDVTVGNCRENACVAAWYLDSVLLCKEWTLIWHEDFDHVYLVIGVVDRTHIHVPHSQWPADLAIYDGWGQIACKARDFAVKWSGKMNEWGATTRNGKPARNAVFIPGEETGFVNPTVWRNAAATKKGFYLK